MQTQSITSPLYFVRSDSNRDLFYTVAAIDDRCACGQNIAGLYHCSCPDHIHRARDCKHIRAALAGQAINARPKARPALTLADVNADLYGEPAVTDTGARNLPDEGMPRIAATPASRRRGLTMAV